MREYPNNCVFIGNKAGADIEENNVVIIGDNIRSLEKGEGIIIIGKMAIGKKLFGKDCNLYDILKEKLSEELKKI